MRKVEYRCNHCMIVESKWLLNNDMSSDYITCPKCGLVSEKIGAEEASRSSYVALDALDRNKGKAPEFF